MRIVATHMDYSLHWPARLQKLKEVVEANGDELQVIEVATRGSPYEFSRTGAAAECGRQGWITLFGDAELPRLSPRDIDRKLWAALERVSPDVVMAGPIAFPVGTTAVRWCRARRRGVIVTDDARLEDVPLRIPQRRRDAGAGRIAFADLRVLRNCGIAGLLWCRRGRQRVVCTAGSGAS